MFYRTQGNSQGVNLPNVNVDLPALSEKDKSDLSFGVEQGVRVPSTFFVCLFVCFHPLALGGHGLCVFHSSRIGRQRCASAPWREGKENQNYQQNREPSRRSEF